MRNKYLSYNKKYRIYYQQSNTTRKFNCNFPDRKNQTENCIYMKFEGN